MTAPSPIRVLVVDDHTLFRRGLIALLSLHDEELHVAGEAGNAGEAQRRATELQPDLILLDNHLPGVRGIDALPTLLQAAPKARVLMLTVSEDEDDLADALKAGASGYVLKTIEGDALVEAIRRCVAGESVVSPELTGKLIGALRAAAAAPEAAAPAAPPPPADPLAVLSPREREIVQHLAAGLSNKEIARRLDIAETTVKIHVQHVLRKLDLKSRVQAAVFAVGSGLGG
ncbi:response regulator [Ideonella sp.]|uniref:response regulator n=1 Tax=Ideonella sp. TaxID=1929293 RepID=UPI002B482990|nr:response regulator [Ideonella sp.]HJV71585.1 response regulator [Ideonella sp.]